MIRIIMHGACGHMGRVITDIVADDPDMEIVAGIDPAGLDMPYQVFSSCSECTTEADAIIDFSTASAVDSLLDFALEHHVPLVLCTTGLSEEQLTRVDEVSKSVPVLRSANMSLGINTMMDLLKKATRVFGDAGFDVEIVEAHHNRKLDAPSGTAIALADAVNEAADGRYEYVYDRSQRRQARDKKELGISAIRGGNIVGYHEVIFAGMDEVITLKHQATSRSVFAKGAVEAARFLADQKPGMYDMSDVIAAKTN